MFGSIAAGGDTSGGFTQTALLIILILALGAIAYLRHRRFLRRRTAITFAAIAVLALIAVAYATYR